MDPVTHAVIGLAISAFSGDPVSLMNPISVGAALGAMSPDLDFVTKLIFGNKTYLKYHRGKSHSVPVLIVLSLAITWMLSFFYIDFNVTKVLMFTFIGALSHTFFDVMNSYGAVVLNKKRRIPILMLYDPLISILSLFMIFYKQHNIYTYIGAMVTFIAYLGARLYMKKSVEKNIKKIYANGYNINKICIMPSLMAIYKWDFVIDSKMHNIVGQYNMLNKKIVIRDKFKKDAISREKVLNTNLGNYFLEFSPNFHVLKGKENGIDVLKVIDLRYFLKGKFMHNGLIELDKHGSVSESYLQLYQLNKKILVNENIGA